MSARDQPRATLPLLEIAGLQVEDGVGGVPLRGVSIRIHSGEVLGLAGPSGAGKSLTALSVLGLLPEGLRVREGRVEWRGEDLLLATAPRLREVRRREIGIVFQDALSALHPCHPVLQQVEEAVRAGGASQARERAIALLHEVGVPDPAAWGLRFPHEWSGGMRQRALIAIALANDPDLLIADEPTASLDVTVQAQIMALLAGLQASRGLAVLLISHDLALLGERADRIAVMADGRVAEAGAAADLLERPGHAVTKELARSWLGADRPLGEGTGPTAGSRDAALLEAESVAVELGGIPAVRDVSMALAPRECVALIGESGCGKSTFARALIGLEPPTAGRVRYRGEDIRHGRGVLRTLRREVQLVLQDSPAALNPRRSVAWSVGRPIDVQERVSASERRQRVHSLIRQVDLDENLLGRRPAELSGGECQRVSLARALSVDPRVLVLDEPFASLDAHRRLGLIMLLRGLRERLGLSLVLISHDLSSVEALADRVYVIYLGRVVEEGAAWAVLGDGRHPYTRSLLAAQPRRRPAEGQRWPTRLPLVGEVPDPSSIPEGCPFEPRCSRRLPRCVKTRPELLPATAPGEAPEDSVAPRRVACFNPWPGAGEEPWPEAGHDT